MTAKTQIIKQVYYNIDTGFSSISDTYKQANKILNTITYKDVKDFLDKQKSRQTHAYKGYNSYVASEPLQEIQIDLLTMTKSYDEFSYILVAVDIFTKICHAVPVKNKQPEESVRAIKEVFNIIGLPQIIYHDNEGSWNSKQFLGILKIGKVKQLITSAPAPFVERMNQTLRNMIENRLRGLELSNDKWTDVLPSVLKRYNNTFHSTIGMTPNEAKKKENKIQVFLNIKQKAEHKRKYPSLHVNDMVRVIVKKHTFTKGWHSAWSENVYKIEKISDNGKQFYVSNNSTRPYLRHDLLKIEAVESK